MFSVDNLDFELDDDLDDSNINVSFENKNNVECDQIFRKPALPKHAKENINLKVHDGKDNHRSDDPPKAVLRKFPGPAGLLPDKPPRSFNDTSLLIDQVENHVDDKVEEPILCSQSTELIFSEPPFKRLKKDYDVDGCQSVFRSFTVDWVKRKALSKGLKGRKIPFLAVILQTVDSTSADPFITLRDRTGELSGTLHRDAWQEISDKFRPGAAIVLKEVGVLSTGKFRHVVLNVTRNNIVSIYTPTEEGKVIVHVVQKISSAELIRSINEWQTKSAQTPSPAIPNQNISRPNLFPDFSTSSPISTKTHSRLKPASKKTNSELFDDDAIFKEVCMDFEEPNESSQVSSKKVSSYVKPLGLSQAESSILDEVLSGVDLDDFD